MDASEAVTAAASWLAARDRPAGGVRYSRFCWGLRTAFQLRVEQARHGHTAYPAEFPPHTGDEVLALVERWLVVFGPPGGEPADRDECLPVLVDDATGQVLAGWPEPWLDGQLWWCLSPQRHAAPGTSPDAGVSQG